MLGRYNNGSTHRSVIPTCPVYRVFDIGLVPFPADHESTWHHERNKYIS